MTLPQEAAQINGQGRIYTKIAVTPSDATRLTFDALYIGVGGTLVYQSPGEDNDATPPPLLNIASGSLVRGGAVRVLATGTTCTDIVGFRVQKL